jgi:hypothetical protein
MDMKKILITSSIMAAVVGVILMSAGIWGICFTYKNIAQEKIVTAADAVIPGQPVRGPFTLKAQADIIREHVLKITEGKTYAEMSRDDANRNLWITAITLRTALNLGILAYAFSGIILLFGCIFLWVGYVLYVVTRKINF